jgi:uncharacterized protein YcbX
MTPVIHSLHVYPIKSCQGIDFDSVELTTTGFKYDRHWMLVDKQGEFISQRLFPKMASIKTEFSEDTLVASNEQGNQIEIPLKSDNRSRTSVKIWNDNCSAGIVSGRVSEWFSDTLDCDCDLVYLPVTETRQVDTAYANEGQSVAFADGFPLLVLSRASIDLLNDKLGETVNINRFRANIIIDGCQAHEEDQWSKISVCGITIKLAKACSRCIIPSIDQYSAEKHKTLLKILAGYRRRDGKIYMGQNGLHLSTGEIRVGQPVEYRQK